MSAIAGIIRSDGRPVDRATLERMQTLLTPYGQDAQNHWLHGSAALLRTLLRTTPEDRLDRQPLVDAEHDIALVFDGRIDNREELAEALSISEEVLVLMADSDLVLHACRKWNDDTPRHLLGDFALACWRPSRSQLWLARDPLGTRPLFWHQDQEVFAFSTMPKGLFALPGVVKELNDSRIYELLFLLPVSGPESFFKDIYRVEPGEVVTLTHQDVKRHRYHRFDPRKELKLASDQEYVDVFRRELERAVKCRLRAIGPVSSMLSSGLDSSTVTALAARQLAESHKPLTAYTSVPRKGFDGPVPRGRHADEGPGAALTASRYSNIEHRLVYTDHISLLETLDEQYEMLDRPPLNPCNAVWVNEIQKRAAKQGSRALLVGNHGNMTISYSGSTYFASLLRKGRLINLYTEMKKTKRQLKNASWRLMIRNAVMPNLPHLIWLGVERYRKRLLRPEVYSAIHPDVMEKEELIKKAKLLGRDVYFQPPVNSQLQRIRALYGFDRGEFFACANAHGVEVRDPTADLRVVELCLSIPDNQFQHNGELSSLLKRAMDGLLPEEILTSRTRGFQMADWFEKMEGSLEQFVDELESIEKGSYAGKYIDINDLREKVRDWPTTHDTFGSPEVYLGYRGKLLRGVAAGGFVRYYDKRNT